MSTTPPPGTLRPPRLPRDARAFMNFQGEFAAAIERHTQAAIAAGRWRVPEDIEINPRNPESLAYWLYKSWNPIVRGMPGRGVEERLAPFRRTHFDLLPDGFEPESGRALSIAGDLMCTVGLDGAQDRFYADVAELIFGADIAYANLESTLTSGAIAPTTFTADETPKINLAPAQYATLIGHRGRRFDVVQLANNHILDCGEEGVATTLARLRADGVAQVGVNATAEDAARPRILELRGLRIGWVAHTFSVNFKPFPADKPWIVNVTPFHLVPDPDVTAIEAQVRACRAAGCDLVCVALHWGLEFELYPHPEQLRWAHRFADAGADLIIGHHPHVPQPVEIYRPPAEPHRAVPILYSVGNLTSVVSHPSNVVSLVARIGLARGRDARGTRTVVRSLDLTPVVLVGEEAAGGAIVRLLPAVELLRLPLEPAMRAYADEVARYADVVLGEGWRTTPTASA